MAASAYEYEQGVSDVMMQDAARAGDNQYQRFLSNRNYGRQSGDMQRQFRAEQPKFGAHFASRGMLNSGIYRQDLSDRFRQYQDNQTRLAENEMATQSALSNQQAAGDQQRLQALLALFERFQGQRAQEDPFANLLNPYELVRF